MKKLEKFLLSIDKNHVVKDSLLKSIVGGRSVKSKYSCRESTSEGTCCDHIETETKDYNDGTSTTTTTILDC